MKRVLLIGRGFVGAEFAKQLSGLRMEYRQIWSAHDPVKEIKSYRPDALINAAGYCGTVNVDDCEHERQRTYQSNVVLPAKIAEICHQMFIPWVHVSSGCLWDQTSCGRYRRSDNDRLWYEHDEPTILEKQVYAHSKYLAEQLIAGSLCTICRIRMPFSGFPHPRNLITKIVNYPMAMDGRNSLSDLEESVEVMLKLLEKRHYGVFHVVNSGSLTTEQMLKHIQTFINPKRAWPIVSQNQLMNPSIIANRSVAVLSTRKMESIGLKMRPVEEAFKLACKRYGKN